MLGSRFGEGAGGTRAVARCMRCETVGQLVGVAAKTFLNTPPPGGASLRGPKRLLAEPARAGDPPLPPPGGGPGGTKKKGGLKKKVENLPTFGRPEEPGWRGSGHPPPRRSPTLK